MIRILAVIAAIVAVILFAVYGINTSHPVSELAWGLVALAAAVGFLALDGARIPSP